MTFPRPRPFWQIHLSTAIVLMFVAGGLMCANMTPKIIVGYHDFQLSGTDWYRFGYQTLYGWPFHCYSSYKFNPDQGSFDQVTATETYMLAADAIFAVAQVLLAAFIMEAITRRKESDRISHDRRRRVAVYASIVLVLEFWFIANILYLPLPAVTFRVTYILTDYATPIAASICAAYICHHFLRQPAEG